MVKRETFMTYPYPLSLSLREVKVMVLYSTPLLLIYTPPPPPPPPMIHQLILY